MGLNKFKSISKPYFVSSDLNLYPKNSHIRNEFKQKSKTYGDGELIDYLPAPNTGGEQQPSRIKKSMLWGSLRIQKKIKGTVHFQHYMKP
jgi:hypothetical protein